MVLLIETRLKCNVHHQSKVHTSFLSLIFFINWISGRYGPGAGPPGLPSYPLNTKLPHLNDSTESEQQEVVDTNNKKQVRMIHFSKRR